MVLLGLEGVVMFRVDTNGIKDMERDLKEFGARAYPFATKSTVNGLAFAAQRNAKGIVSKTMTTRNKFTVQSIQVDQARTLQVKRQYSSVGSTADYMETQEFGGTKTKTGKEGVSISTSYSAGQGMNSQPRTKLPKRANKLENIRLQRRRKKGNSRKQQNLAAIKGAAEGGSKYVFLDLGRRKGIFKVTGGKRRPKIRMVHDLTRQSVAIPKSPWLLPAVTMAETEGPRLYAKSLEFQLRRLGLFK